MNTKIRWNVLLPCLLLLGSWSHAADFVLLEDVEDQRQFGWGWGEGQHRDRLSAQFTGSGRDLHLFFSVYDADAPGEVEVLLNGQHLGDVSRGRNRNLTPPQLLTIKADRLLAGDNILEFVQARRSGDTWGVTDLLLTDLGNVSADFSLQPGQMQSGEYGWRWGTRANRERVIAEFQNTGQDIELSVTGYDIDNSTEVAVRLNGELLGTLAKGSNNQRTAPQTYSISAAQQSPGNNRIVFYQARKSGWIWGVTDVIINTIGEPPNAAPLAQGDSATTEFGSAVALNVLENDSDTDGSLVAESIVISRHPQHGSLIAAGGGVFEYQHDGSAVSEDSFSYVVSDDDGEPSNEATATITINPLQPPLANPDAVQLAQSGEALIDILANDSSGAALDSSSVFLVDGPNHAASFEVRSDGTIWYQHDGNGSTSDSLVYRVSNVYGMQSNDGQIDISIDPPPNLPPVAADDQLTLVSGGSGTLNVIDNDTDSDGTLNTDSIVLHASPLHGHLQSLGGGSFSYTHDGSANLTDSFQYSVADNLGLVSNIATVEIVITPVLPPVANDDQVDIEQGQSVLIHPLANDTSSAELDASSIIVLDGAYNAEHFEVRGDGSILYQHNAGGSTEDFVAYRISDVLGMASNTARITINIAEPVVNVPPIALADSASVELGEAVSIAVMDNDTDEQNAIDTDSVTIVQLPQHGAVEVAANGEVVYTQDGSFNSTDSFSYTIRDTQGATSEPATVNIAVEIPDLPPLAVEDSASVVIGQSVVLEILANDSDPNNDIDASSVDVTWYPMSGGTVVLSDGSLQYSHDGGPAVSDSLSYKVSDSTGLESNVVDVNIEIEPAMQPTAVVDTARVARGGSVLISVLDNDTANTEIDVSSIFLVDGPQWANDIAVNADGTILYTHDGGDSTSDSFSYRVSNIQGMQSTVGTVNITVGPALVTISDLNYLGGFALPSQQYGDSSLNYAQGVIEVNGDSMFIVGHDHDDAIAEFTVPELVNSVNISDLNTASAPSQGFVSILDRAVGGNAENLDQIVGLEMVDGSLIANVMEYYDAPADNTLTTLVVADAQQLASSPVSAFHAMQGAARAAGWISSIPGALQASLGGSYIAGHSSGEPIIARLSAGPSAYAVNFPADLQSATSLTISTTPLQLFSLDNPLSSDLDNASLQNSLWTHMSHARYGFIVPGTKTYMTLGWSGGHNSGVAYKSPSDGRECGGFCPNSATDLYNYYWLWNLDDWEKVQNGELAAHAVRPYEKGELALPFQTSGVLNEVGGASYDAASGRLYISLLRANNTVGPYDNPPVIAVYTIGSQP